MELFDLEYGLNAVASGGNVLNCQEFTGIQSGLTLLKSKEKYSEMYFWGKIFGQKDYYIAYGLKDPEFEFPSKNFYYAGEDFEFYPLPRLTEDAADKVIEFSVDRAFTGNPEDLLQPPGTGEEAAPPQDDQEDVQAMKLTELDALAQVVQEIDFDTAVVPKGAHALNEAHVVVQSSDFKGLGLSEAAMLSKYVHFRPPASVACLRALARTDAQFYANFLDPLEADLPKGCWAIRQDPSASLVTLRSLNWPGYIAFHVPGSIKFGGLYFGYATKCRDLPFLI